MARFVYPRVADARAAAAEEDGRNEEVELLRLSEDEVTRLPWHAPTAEALSIRALAKPLRLLRPTKMETIGGLLLHRDRIRASVGGSAVQDG